MHIACNKRTGLSSLFYRYEQFRNSNVPHRSRWYNEKALNYQKEPAVTICKKRVINCVDPVYEHQIAPDFDLLHDIHHTQAFSENAKQNLSHQAKYNQGFGYAKRAIGIS